MFTETRKTNLIQEVMNVNTAAILSELESVLAKSKKSKPVKPLSAHDFVGCWNKKDANLIEKAIENGCEQIHEDEWK